jgi:putative multiple sugar transport system substrate-binding protein
MKKRIAGILLGFGICVSMLAGCGQNQATEAANESAETEKEGNGTADAEEETAEEDAASVSEETEEDTAVIVGVLLPDDETSSASDAQKLSEAMAPKGMSASVYYADEDPDLQVEQFQQLLDEGVTMFVIDPVDAYAFTDALNEAEELESDITVISYDQLVMNTDQLSYYVTFDYRAMGHQAADRIIKDHELEKKGEGDEPVSIEFFMGSLDDEQALFFFNGVLENLQPYLDNGTLVCKSGQMTFQDTGILREDPTQASKRLQSLMEEYYEGQAPDILVTGFDAAAAALADTLESAEILPGSEAWPYITGLGCEAEAVRGIAEGKIVYSFFLERGKLAEKCVNMLEVCLGGDSPEVDNYEQYDNGVKIIGTDICDGQLIDADNYELLIDNGYYTAEEIEPQTEQTDRLEQEAGQTSEDGDAASTSAEEGKKKI